MSDAYGYARISDDRDGNSLGTLRQREDIEKKAADLGWQIVGFYVDDDITADPRKKARPEFQRLMEDMRSGKVKRLLCYDQDRLVRDPRELEDIVDAVEAGQVDLTSVNGSIDLRTDSGRLVARVKGAFAKSELEKLSRRVKRQQLQHAQSGKKHQGSHRTFGFTRAMEPIPDEKARVIELFRRKAAGESLTSLAAWLNDEGVATTGGGTWDASLMSRLIRRHDYVGEIAIKGEVVGKAKWEPFVSRDDWLLANEDVERNNFRGKRARRSLLAGFLICGNCLTKMKQGGAAGEQRYNCPSPKAVPGACGSCSITTPKTDLAVWNAAYSKEQTAEPVKPDGPARDFATEEAALEAERLQVLEYRASGALSLQDAVPMLNDIRSKLAKVQREAAIEAMADDLGHFQTLFDWEGWSLSKQRVWLDRYVSYVLVTKADPSLPKKGFKPDRLEVHFTDGTVQRLEPRRYWSPKETAKHDAAVLLAERPGTPGRTCSLSDCFKPFYSKDMCHNHYKAAWRREKASRTAAE